jgi:hypothetical protein
MVALSWGLLLPTHEASTLAHRATCPRPTHLGWGLFFRAHQPRFQECNRRHSDAARRSKRPRVGVGRGGKTDRRTGLYITLLYRWEKWITMNLFFNILQYLDILLSVRITRTYPLSEGLCPISGTTFSVRAVSNDDKMDFTTFPVWSYYAK